MVAELIPPSPGTAAAYGGAGGAGADARPDAVCVGAVSIADEFAYDEAAYDETEVADAFDVHVLPVGPVAGYPDVDTVGEADLVMALLRRLGGHATDEGGARTLTSLTEADDALARWAGEGGDRQYGPSALLWFGHGVTGTMGPALLVPASDKRDARVTPDMLAHYLYAEQRRRDTEEGHWAIVVIEACNSTNFAEDVYVKFLGSGRPEACSLLLIATGRPGAQGYLGTFRAALETYVDDRTCRDEVFSLRELQVYLKGDGAWAELLGTETSHELKLRLRDRVPLSGAVTVAEQRRLQREFDRETAPRGVPAVVDAPGFLEVVPEFTGRSADLTAIADWCADPDAPPVLVVTGPPGTGKSALLGEVLRRFREPAADEFRGVYVDAVLRLTGSTPDDVLHQLAQSLGVNIPDATAAGASPDRHGDVLDRLRHRLTALAARHRTLILADALDEARDPVQVACLLRDLTDLPGVTLLIGTRISPYGESEASGSGRVDLRDVLGATLGHARVRELGPDPDAAAQYAARGVRRVLREHPAGDAAWQEAVVGTVREAVRGHVGDGSWQFLQAALVVQEIEQRPGTLAPDPESRAALQRLLALDRTGLFPAAVARICDGLPTAGAFLRALAFGQGRGLPRADGIWARAAAGVAASERPLDNRELSLFLSRAAAYVLLDGEDRRSVYRLAHRTYAEQLQADSTPEQRQGMLTALLDLAAAQIDAGQPLSPHLEARLAQYAADCGAQGWAELARRPNVVDRLPLAALSALALAPGRPDGGATAVDLPIEVLGTVASAHLIEESLPADRPGLRQLGGLRATGRWHEAGPDAAWEVCWGRVRTVPPHLQLGGADGAVSALTAHPSESWLVTGSLDGTVVVWEPWRAHCPALLLRGCDRPVSALAAVGTPTGNDGPGLLAVAHDDGTLQLWDTAAEHPAPATTMFPEAVRVMAALPDGTRRFALGGEAGRLALLGPEWARPRSALTVSLSAVVGLAPVGGTGGRQWLAAAYRSGELALWDVSGVDPALLAKLSTRQALAALTTVTDAEGRLRLVTAAEDGQVRFWRPTERNGRVELAADAVGEGASPGIGRAPVLATLPGAEGAAVVVGDGGGTLRLLSPVGGPGHPVCDGAGGKLRAVTVLGCPDGGHVLVTAALRDPRVRFWVPGPGAGTGGARAPEWSPPTGLRRHVAADGKELLVLTESDGTAAAAPDGPAVRVLLAADGTDLTDRLPPGPHTVNAATVDEAVTDATRSAAVPDAVARLHDRRVRSWVALLGEPYAGLWASAGREGVVALWRKSGPADSWEPMRRIPLGAKCGRLTALSGGRLAVTTDDGIVVLAIRAVASDVDAGGTEETDV